MDAPSQKPAEANDRQEIGKEDAEMTVPTPRPSRVQPNQPNQPITPGPCPPGGCPPPTEIACIETNYIYDSCFMPVERELTGAIPLAAAIPVDDNDFDPDAPFTVESDVETMGCDEIGREPANDGDDGLFNVTMRIEYSVSVEIIQNGVTYFTGTLNDVFFRTARLCAPEGATVNCARYSTAQPRAFAISFDEDPAQANVQVNANICLVTQSSAPVQLLVPAYGFAVPTECQTPVTEICLPNMFPPRCGTSGNNGRGA